MKSFIAFILAALCATAMSDMRADWTENSKQCSQKNNVSLDDMRKVILGEIKPADVTTDMKCYFLCMSELEGITKNGVFQPQALSDKLANTPNKDDVLKAIANCKDVKGTDNCDTSYKIMACMVQNKAAM